MRIQADFKKVQILKQLEENFIYFLVTIPTNFILTKEHLCKKTYKNSLGGGGKGYSPTATHDVKHFVSTLENDLDSPLSQDSQKVSEKAQATQTKQVRQVFTHSTLFRPIVATSLALALGVSVSVAGQFPNAELTWDTTGEIASDNGNKIQWAKVNNFLLQHYKLMKIQLQHLKI